MEQKKGKCIIISGAPSDDLLYINGIIKKEDYIICADSGLSAAESLNIEPDMVVGDFDSYKGNVKCKNVKMLPIMKDDTDTLSAVKEGYKLGYTDFALVNAVGGRIDHSFANISVLEYINSLNCKGKIITDKEEIFFLKCGKTEFINMKGKTVSVFPFGCDSVTVTYTGMKYALNSGIIKSDFPKGISNIIIEDRAVIEILRGKALVIVNKRYI